MHCFPMHFFLCAFFFCTFSMHFFLCTFSMHFFAYALFLCTFFLMRFFLCTFFLCTFFLCTFFYTLLLLITKITMKFSHSVSEKFSNLFFIFLSYWGPSIKYVTLFLANFYPPLPCHTSSHIPGPIPPESTSHISDPPISRRPSTKYPDKSPLVQILFQLFAGVFVRGVLSGGLLSGRFCPGWF